MVFDLLLVKDPKAKRDLEGEVERDRKTMDYICIK